MGIWRVKSCACTMGNECCCFACIKEDEVKLVERFGNYTHTAMPGCNVVAWPMDNYVGTLSTRIQQIITRTPTKTKDNVQIAVHMAVQFKIIEEHSYEAYYKLTNVDAQIQSYVDDV